VLNSSQVEFLIDGIRRASEIVMSFYRKPDLHINQKSDLSPVTEADLASHLFFKEFLERNFPGIPLISEEGIAEDYRIRKTRGYTWILDPVDGTSEFIAGNGEFAINLALLHHDHPIFGIIAIPAKDIIYYAIKGEGSWKVTADGARQRLPLTESDYLNTKQVIALSSRSHAGIKEQEYFHRLEENGWQVNVRPTGSAYKHVLLAEGSAHFYYKPGICQEWDTAPGQLILEEAGGSVRRMSDGKPLVYNKDDFANPGFTMWAPGVFIPL